MSPFAIVSDPSRIHLAVPHMGGSELGYVREAFETNWLSTVGPNINAFEKSLEERCGRSAVALSSGTAAIHLGLLLLGVKPGDDVICSSLTFVASANPISYVGANPVFVDSQHSDWNMDPELVEAAIVERQAEGHRVAAIVAVHLYGQCCDMDALNAIGARYDIPVFEDAAEGLGATYKKQAAGTLAPSAAISFNGNKIITTTGGGAYLAKDKALADKARFLSTQARDPGIAYEHTEMGFNYRMSNVLAGIGRGQLEVLEQRVQGKRLLFDRYVSAFGEHQEIIAMPEAPDCHHTRWLSTFTLDNASKVKRDDIIAGLAKNNIEARPVWKPMHLQPLFKNAPMFGGSVAESLFERGFCLPSSTNMSDVEFERVVEAVCKVVKTCR